MDKINEQPITLVPVPKAAKMLKVSEATLLYWRKHEKYPELRWVQYGGVMKKRFGYYLEDIIKFQEAHPSNSDKYKIYDEDLKATE